MKQYHPHDPNEDLVMFIKSIHEALPEFASILANSENNELSFQRKFFLKEFQLLKRLAEYYPENSVEKQICQKAIRKWLKVDKELARSPLDLKKVNEKIDSVSEELKHLIDNKGDSLWMK